MLDIKRRDLSGGDMKFGERLQMAQIMSHEDEPELKRVADIIECLHGVRPDEQESAELADYAIDVAEQVVAWIKREREECSVPPLPDAVSAGVEDYAKAVGDMGNVVALADRFGLIPFSRVYELPYLDVFMLWKVDAESAKFQRRLDKVHEEKFKKHGKL